MTPAHSPRRRRTAATAAATMTALALLELGGVGAATAHADTRSLRSSCNPAVDAPWVDVIHTQVDPIVTDYLTMVVVGAGSGTRTDALPRVASVTTSVDGNPTITAAESEILLKAEAWVGFPVQKTTSSTGGSTLTTTWSYNQPDRYGLYRGTRKVLGEYVKYVCVRTGPDTGEWVSAVPGSGTTGTFITYGSVENGIVRCARTEAAGTLRRAAQVRLGC
ncbi:hypothetical protein ACFVUH_14765 [Kitasatospora sp. NPDC058032]|uniref:hypothetical protein n=1 Tax=Kitasatospora sp. NPDC058032 TaxID=3346307 RepID=UPI0036DD1EF0